MKVVLLSISVSLFSSLLLYDNPAGGILLLIPVYLFLKKYIAGKGYKRWKNEVLFQFGEMLRSLATALQVGYSIENAFFELTRQFNVMYGETAPIMKELKVICHGLKMNITIEKLLYGMAQRTGLTEMMEYAEIVNVAKHSGGNLIDITKHNADIIHQKRQMITEIETMAAAKKYESIVMNIMPVGILIYLRVTSKAYISALYSNPAGNALMTVLFVLYIFAAWLGNYITDFDKTKKIKIRKKKKVSKTLFSAGIVRILEKRILKSKKGMIDEEIKLLWVNTDKECVISEFWGKLVNSTILASAVGIVIFMTGVFMDMDNIALYLSIAGSVVVVVPYRIIYRIKEKGIERKNQLLLDYPELLDKMSLLLGAGLSVKGTIKRIAGEYIARRDSGKTDIRYAYEELVYMMRRLDNGIPETVVYEEWGRRSRMIIYMKLSSAIIQNLKKGNQDMLEQFRMMSLDAMEERNTAVKQMGEKASSKLLLPMMLQFTIILAVIMYPAITGM